MEECTFCHNPSVDGGILMQFCEEHHEFVAKKMRQFENIGMRWQEAEMKALKLMFALSQKELPLRVTEYRI